MVIIPKPVPYAGSVPLYVRTYTQSYPKLSGTFWDFAGAAPYPMEWAGYVAPGTATAIAYSAQLIDFVSGYSRTDNGDITNTTQDNGNFREFTYSADLMRVCGWPINGTRNPLLASSYLTWDGQHRINTSNGFFGAGFSLPALANTQIPNPGRGTNALVSNNGVYTSGEIALDPISYIWSPGSVGGGVSSHQDVLIGLDFPTDARFGRCLAYGASSIVVVDNGTGGDNPYNYVQTDFVSFANYVQLLASPIPNSNIDFLAFFKSSANQQWSMCHNGWVQFWDQNLVIAGKDYGPGFGIFCPPDFSTYTILEVIGMDDLASQIFTKGGNGTVSGKYDRSGNKVWMKTANIGNVLFIADFLPNGTGPQTIHNLWQIPPVNLPQNPGLYR